MPKNPPSFMISPLLRIGPCHALCYDFGTGLLVLAAIAFAPQGLEDGHVFRQSDLLRAGDEAGLRVAFVGAHHCVVAVEADHAITCP